MEQAKKEPLQALLHKYGVILGDGAMGTMLQSLGLEQGECPELWNITQPEKVQSVQRGYIEAGSMVIETNTFGGTRFRLAMHGLEDQVSALNKAGVEIAKEMADTKALVAGSVGPSGELLFPLGTLSYEEVRDGFTEQAQAMIEGGVDLFIVETMSDLQEIKAAIEGIRAVSGDERPIITTMTFETRGHTMMGVSPEQALTELYAASSRYIGANCGNGPEETGAAIKAMAPHRPEDVVLVVQSNAGLPHWQNGDIIYDGTPDIMAKHAVAMYEAGARYIGACCGSTPAHIRAMATALGLR